MKLVTFPRAWDVPRGEFRLGFDCRNLYEGDMLDMVSDSASEVWTRTPLGGVNITFMTQDVI